MYRFGILLALFVVLHAAKVRKQLASQQCIPEDVTFLVDSSSYVGADYYRMQLDFIKATINNYNIAPQCTRVSVVTFSDGAYNAFYLNQYSNKAALFNAIDNMQYRPAAARYTTEGLKYMMANSFSTSHGGRSNVPHIGVLVSNGPPANSQAFLQSAQQAKGSGIKLYTVGVGTGGPIQQFATGASSPSSRYSLTADSYSSLNSLSYPLAYRTMGEVPAVSSQKQTCLQRADIVFLVDGSGSIGPTNFNKLKTFLKGITGQLDVGADKVHVGVEQFSNYPSIEFPLNMHTTSASLNTAIDGINYMSGGTNTGSAIDYMSQQMFSQTSGARANVPRIAVVITDGKSSSSSATATAADQARQNHISLMAVGVGNGVDINELHSIADDPDSANTFTVSSYDQLNSIATQIIQKACQVRATAPPVSSTNSGATLQPDPCQDSLADCKRYGQSVCVDYAPWAHDNCQRYCGFCNPLYTTAPPPCVDLLSNCPNYGDSVCKNPLYQGWAQDNCRKFCGFCRASAVGFYGKCSYKGKSYNPGEKWADGCDYECVCEDGASGRYKCYNKCPVYYNLPAECTLVRDPQECCQKPVCNFNQNLQTFEQTSPAKTATGVGVCVYKGKQYYESQSWKDGCSYQCTCTNGNTGLYKCESLCPQYQSLPPYCHMVKKAGKCCTEPVCEFKTQTGSFTGTGSISGVGVGKTPTTPPPCVDQLSNCERYGTDVCTGFTSWATVNCRKYCNLCDVKPTPGTTDRCMYQGQAYSEGQGWKVSCDTECVCENAIYGYYRCTNTCPTYNNLQKGCYEVKKAGQCCPVVECENGVLLTSTNNLGTIGSGGLINVVYPPVPQAVPTLPTGGQPVPGTGGTGFVAPSLKGCLYKGEMYIQDQTWQDGCKYTCQCQDASTGLYRCNERCPTYLNLPAACTFETDSNDDCCQKPKCPDPNTPIVPTFGQSNIGHGVIQPPSITDLYQNYSPVPYTVIYNTASTTRSPATSRPGGVGYCLRNGQKHLQGEQWNEGCDYICTCEDASTGKWKCTQRCRVYSNLPKPYCYLVQDPNDACCQKPECNFNAVTTIFNGSVSPVQTVTQRPTTTPRPTTPKPHLCVYNGKQYSQGQVWFDGCNYKCTCDDAYGGIYRCVNRCPVYQNVPDVCTMVPDQSDPTCCQMPKCDFQPVTNTIPGQGQVVSTLAPGVYQGTGTGVNIGYCMYKGKQYQQGQTWDDGCDFHCECKDQNTGRYVCSDLCPRYSDLPAQCRLISDFRNPCCKVPDCGFQGVTSSITGQITLAPSLPGQPTPSPNPLNPNPTPGMGVPVLNYCLYKGVKYYQGQSWDDGCDKKCLCDRASQGLYTCNDRCPRYTQALPKECRMVTSATDACCQEPRCDIPALLSNITGTISPGMIPTLAPPGVISGNANTPTPMPQAPGQTTLAPKPLNFCVYKGLQYAAGARWDDGCDYTCVCTDGATGHYDCTEKCPKYGQLPRECYLTKDPANPCCQKPECRFNPPVTDFTPAPPTTKAPRPGFTNAPTPQPSGQPNPNPYPTPLLPKAVCVYKGKSYTQGQQWFDDCDYTCTCENAMQGIYRCSRRCTEYPKMTPGCSLVADPKDPLCCKVPQCQIPPKYSNQTGFIDIPTPPSGVITGGSVTKAPTPQPTLAPGQQPSPGSPIPGSTPVPVPVCVYKGSQYTQGQRWQDGCDFNCECTNAQTGYYRCTEMCPKYNGLPKQCQLITDVNKPCCKKPYCNFQGVTLNVTGTPAPNMGTTLAPNPLNPGGPTLFPTPTPPEVCVYNGVQFKQGETWQDGCSLNCVCENGKTGFYRCNERCARYDQVPAGCTMRTDPSDSCCRIPVCTPQPGTTQAPLPGQNPTLSPNPTPPQVPVVTGSIIGVGVTPTPRPGQTPVPNPVPVCVYKGVQYTQGQRWDDGCQYKCECIDANAGKYRCTKRCGKFPSLPSTCSLVNDPKDQCCRVPFCQPNPVATPAPNPNPQSGTTLAPGINPTLTPNPNPNPNPTPNPNPNPIGPTPAPKPKNVCVMNGRSYTQGQQWYDGCDRICRCEDGSTGFYRCQDRCRKYDTVPQNCILVADPKDPQCCKVPSCIPGPNGFPTPTPGPDGSTVAPQLITNVPVGVVTGYARPTPTATPAPVPVGGTTAKPMPTPAPKEVCVYKGVQYIQGQRWQDGCTYNCVCENGVTGKYKCTERCAAYPALPPYCSLVQDPKDYCCQQPLCNYQTQAPSIPPPLTPSPAPGNPTAAPNPNSTPAPNPLAVCLYKGVAYKQGDTWNEGCVQRCRCDDASKNIYTCFDRCPSYKLNPGCVMTTDPNDPCCQVPSCTVVPTPMPVNTPSPMPGVNTVAPGTVATPVPSAYPSPIPTGQVGTIVGKPQVPPLRALCDYKGMQYATGQKWQDGCQYDCECIDGTTGQYRCTEKCPRYAQIPSYCYLVQDPKDPCCKVPNCNVVAPTPRPIGTPTPGPIKTPLPGSTFPPTLNPPVTPGPIPTPQPQPKNACIMNGKSYTQGQQWNDGCKQICVCDDGTTGHYTCRSRCAQYPNIAPSCIMVPDPSDPKCCQIPQCDQTNPNQPSGVTGSITGTNPTPNPTPFVTPNPNPNPNPNVNPTPQPYPYPTPYPGYTYPPNMIPSPNPNVTPAPGQPTAQPPSIQPTPQPKVCVYKGKTYSQGQKWRDGCDYNCECQDGMTGRYVCTEICPRYPNLPVGCVMLNDPANPCCKKPDCSNPTPVPVLTPSPRPGVNPTPAPTNTPAPSFCVYNGVPYQAGKTFEDGCDKICTCESGMSGQVTCKDRCPTFPPLKSGCRMVTDPNDKCCQTPTCVNSTTLVPYSPGGTINGQNVPPSPGSPSGGNRNVCVYNGKIYTQGQQWDDGCTYHCVCLDASTGHYQCTEKCNRVPQLPPYCTMVNDPNDQCCQMPYCQNPNPTPNPTPSPNGSPTLAPNPGPNSSTPAPKPRDVCVYKNSQYYRQDQQWYDGCNAICRCENAATGYYRCQERCARYTSVPAECTLVPDPKDPSCCQVPKCPVKPTAGPVPTPGFVPTPVTAKPGELTGLAPVPTNQPTPSPQPGQTPGPTLAPPLPKSGCYYKGVPYQKDQTWSDGCQYDCVCLDDMTGQYKCTEKCTKYPNLDSHCVLIQDTQNPCCQKPYCDFLNPTPFPNGIPTPQPIMTPSPMPGNPSVAPNTVPTPVPNPTRAPPPGYCVYKGVFYTQGQTWNDGCDKTCQCDDVTTGYISCHPRCRTYPSVPAGCVLKTDPKDSCCVAPDCNKPNILNPTPQPNPTPGPGGVTLNPNVNPSTSGVMIYPSPVPTGSFIGSGINPGGTSGTGYPGTLISGNTKACIYKGVAYNQGDKWEDNCQYKCECIDATRGQYRCTDRCYTYPPLPAQCSYDRDPNDACCQIAKCTPYIPTYGPTVSPSITLAPTPGTPIVINPGTNTPSTGSQTTGPIIINPNTNTPSTGTKTTPFVINPVTYTPNSGSNTTPKPANMCLYKGGLHPQGSNWQDGCDYTCYCVDAMSNSYRCQARCKSYSSIPTYCRLIPDPADQCCEKVECTAPNGQVLTPQIPNGPTVSPTLAPSVQHVIPVGTHQVFTGSGQPNFPVTGSTGTSGSRSGCIYKSNIYHQGQSWDDGCKYVCSCMDEASGLYKCTSKCPTYPPLPSYCSFVNVPGQCCPTLSCNSPDFGKYNPAPQLYPTPAPAIKPSASPHIINPGYNTGTSGSQVAPGTVATGFTGSRNNLCIYKNKLYNQGDKWDDGCDYSCECKDATSGYYECTPKCATYKLPTNCYLVRAGGECCPQPMCRNPDGTTVNPLTSPGSQYPVYGTYPGGFTGFRPGYSVPDSGTSFTNRSSVCIYKGSVHRQGDKWEDGCDFQCTCVDASRGVYQCTARCKTYTALPSACKLYDVPGECCSEVRCQNVDTSPTPPVIGGPTVRPYLDPLCHDTIDNCRNYQKDVACRGMYEAWARSHCNLTCGFCTPAVTVQPVCVDRINNCALYGKSVCQGTYQPWATDNCPKYCNLCQNGGGAVTTPAPTPSSQCQDKINNCRDYGKSSCTGKFEPWARDNCRLYCGFCSGSSGQVINYQVLPPTGYMTLMKGVAGVPGDMYQIWTSPATMNTNNPQAMYLTNQFKGHYKTDLSQWNRMCLDRIRVSIYKNGQEKAYVEFNAIGANQNNWFDPSRIISSSYTDINTAAKEVFSMMGDSSTGREFLMSQHSNSNCDTYGWIMISTQNNCPFESSSGNKPAFLYAPGQTSSHFEQTQVGTGDVLAIMGHQGTCIATVRPTFQVTGSMACVYNNKIYNQGDSWTDGCKYNCTCTDARNGNYQCVELCPTYSRLPQGCSLVKRPGSCCAVPDCGTHVYNPDSSNAAERGLCYYKGDVYSQGEKWDDGCQYKCTCLDATVGRYTCDPKCLSWPSLPAGCSLQAPAPGKCCQQPQCPSNVHINFPPGYTIE